MHGNLHFNGMSMVILFPSKSRNFPASKSCFEIRFWCLLKNSIKFLLSGSGRDVGNAASTIYSGLSTIIGGIPIPPLLGIKFSHSWSSCEGETIRLSPVLIGLNLLW